MDVGKKLKNLTNSMSKGPQYIHESVTLPQWEASKSNFRQRLLFLEDISTQWPEVFSVKMVQNDMTWTIMPTSFPGFSPTRASCLCPKVLHNHFFSISPGYYSRPKRNLRRWLRKILESKQGFIMVYEKMMNMGTCKLVLRFSLLGTRLGHDVKYCLSSSW